MYAIDSESDREEESLSAVLNKKKKRVCGAYKQTIHVVASKMHLQLCFEILLLFEFVMKGVWNSIFFFLYLSAQLFFFVSLKDAQVKILSYITFRLQMCLMMTVMIPLKVICGLI